MVKEQINNYGGRGNKIERVSYPCGFCGKEMFLVPCELRHRLKKSVGGILYHKKCYNQMRGKIMLPRNRKFKTKLGTMKPYIVAGNDELGYKITIPKSAICSREYLCNILEGGVLVYTPVMKTEEEKA
jgi:hypothetical protein